MNRYKCITDAVEITKAYASRNDHGTSIEKVLENVYEMLKKLNTDAKNDDN